MNSGFSKGDEDRTVAGLLRLFNTTIEAAHVIDDNTDIASEMTMTNEQKEELQQQMSERFIELQMTQKTLGHEHAQLANNLQAGRQLSARLRLEMEMLRSRYKQVITDRVKTWTVSDAWK